MLVLSRRRNGVLLIGGNVRIVVLDVVGDQVKIGIEAPREIEVIRGELANAEGGWLPRRAANGSPDSDRQVQSTQI